MDSSGWPPSLGWWAQLAEDKISVPPFFYLEHKWTWVDRSHSPRVIHKEDDQDFHFHFHWNTCCGWVDCSLYKGQVSIIVNVVEEDVTPILFVLLVLLFLTCLSCLTCLVLSYHHFSIYQVVVCGRSVVWLFLAHQIFMFLYRGHLTIQYLTHEEKRESVNIWLINWFRHIFQFRKFELCQVWQIRIDGLMTGCEVSQLVTMVKMLTLGFLIPKSIKLLLPHRGTCLSKCCFQSDESVGAVGLVNLNCDVFCSGGQVRVT